MHERREKCNLISRFIGNNHRLAELVEITGRYRGNFFRFGAAQFGHAPYCFDDERGLVTLAAVWGRREIGRVRFDQQAVSGRKRRRVPNALRLGKSNHASKAEMKTQLECLFRFLWAAGETVHDAAER